MGIKQANKSLRFIFIMLCAIVAGYIAMFKPLYEMIDHSPLVNLTIVSVQIIGVIYTAVAYLSIKHAVKDWINFEKRPITDINDVDSIKFGGAIRMLSNRLSELLYAKNEARNALLTALHDSFERRSNAAGYLSGLLVSLGLLGTFIGLTKTMGDIKTAVDYAIDAGGSDITSLLGGIAAPLGGMSAAFGASLLGLLGSIIMGLAAHMLGSASENLYEEIDEWTFAHYQPDESIIGILNGVSASNDNTNTHSVLQPTNIESNTRNGNTVFGSKIVHILNCIHTEFVTSQTTTKEQIQQLNTNLNTLVAFQEQYISQKQNAEQQQLQTLQSLESIQKSLLAALEMQHQNQLAIQNQLVTSQTEFMSGIDRLASTANESLVSLQTLDDKLNVNLTTIHSDITEGNSVASNQNQQILEALEQQHQAQETIYNQLANSQFEIKSGLDQLSHTANDSLYVLQTLNEKLFANLANIQSDIEESNALLNTQCQQNEHIIEQTATHYKNAENKLSDASCLLSENIAFLNENKVSTTNTFDQVSTSLIALKSETNGVRQQLLAIDSVLRERNSEASVIIDALKAQNNTLLASLNEITQARATILTKHSQLLSNEDV